MDQAFHISGDRQKIETHHRLDPPWVASTKPLTPSASSTTGKGRNENEQGMATTFSEPTIDYKKLNPYHITI